MLIKTRKTERKNVKRKSQPKYTIHNSISIGERDGDKRKNKIVNHLKSERNN